MTRCTAPKRGHRTRKSRLECPLHGEQSRTGVLPPLAAVSQRVYGGSVPGANLVFFAKRNDAQAEDLDRLADCDEESVRWEVARHHNTADVTFEKLADDPDWIVLGAVVMNQMAPDSSAGRAYRAMKKTQTKHDEAIRLRLCERLDVRADNTAAVEALMELDWWTLTTDDDETLLVKTIHR